MLVDRNAADAAAAAAVVVLAASTTMASEANLSSCWLSHFPFVTYVVAVFAAVFVFSYYLDDGEAGIEASLDLLVTIRLMGALRRIRQNTDLYITGSRMF